MAASTGEAKKQNGFIRFINAIEKAGNKLPHPFMLFIYLGIIVLVASIIFSGVSVTYQAANATGDGIADKTVVITNLIAPDYIKTILKDWVSIYATFAPLGVVMVMMLAIGFAQNTGLFDAFMKKSLAGAPTAIVTFALALMGVTASVASNAGIVFGVTIGAALFAALGRNPILGAATGYAAAHGGFTASLVPTGTDVLLASITQSVTNAMGIEASTHALNNFYYIFISSFTIAAAVTFITEKVMPGIVREGVIKQGMGELVTDEQKKGLRYALVALLVFVALLLALSLPANSFFRAEDGSLVPSSPLIDSIVAILFFFFVATGLAYGIGSGTVKSATQVASYMGKGIADTISFFVIAYPAALFIRFFNDSNIASVLSVKGADLLKALNFNGVPLAIAFIILCAFCNLFMTSASSKWLILAPIFVPMFYQIGFTPALTQALYRIGDSCANPIAPINFYLPIVLSVMNQYKKKDDPEYGLGTLLSYMLPYSIAIFVVMVIQMVIWMVLNIQLGPATPLYL